MKKRVFSAFSRMGILLLSFSVILANHGSSANIRGLYEPATEYTETMNKNQDKALDAFYALYSYLGIDENTQYCVWPDEYAGCYINSNNDLVICLTTDDEQVRQKYLQVCGESIVFDVSQYSMRAFQELCIVLDTYSNASELYVGYKSDINTLCVTIFDDSSTESLIDYITCYPNKSEELEHLINDSDHTLIIKHEKRNYTALNPGSSIENAYNYAHPFTACIWAYKTINGISWPGIITCGHPFFDDFWEFDTDKATVYTMLNGNVVEFGYTNSSLAFLGNDRDCAFIPQINMYLTPTAMTVSGTTLNQYVSSVAAYTDVYFDGTASGHVSGKTTTEDTLSGAIYINHGYEIQMNTDSGNYIRFGDSGAPVYMYYNGSYALIGIQSSAQTYVSISDAYEYAYVSSIHLALISLGVTLYTG